MLYFDDIMDVFGVMYSWKCRCVWCGELMVPCVIVLVVDC